VSYNKESRILREFVREILSEKLQGVEGMSVKIDPSYDTSYAPSLPTLQQSRGYQRAAAEGVVGTILNLLGMPQSALDLYRNFIGPNGIFNLEGVFGSTASPFGSDITNIGSGLLGLLGGVLGPRNPGAVGQGYWGNLRSALSGNFAVRREALEVQEPAEEVSQLDENSVLSALSEDIQKILGDFDSIVGSPSGVDAIYAWQDKTGFGENATELFEQLSQIEETEIYDAAMNRIKTFIEEDLAPTYYSDIINPVLNGFLSHTGPLSAQAKSMAASMIEDALELINR